MVGSELVKTKLEHVPCMDPPLATSKLSVTQGRLLNQQEVYLDSREIHPWMISSNMSKNGIYIRERREDACFVRPPKTTLRFNSLLEGLTELSKAVIPVVTIYYSERIEVKVSEGKRPRGQGPGQTGRQLPVLSPSGVVWTALNSPTDV